MEQLRWQMMLQFNDLARAFIATRPNNRPLSSTYINADNRTSEYRTGGCVKDWRDNNFALFANAFSKCYSSKLYQPIEYL
jgi:hypothetical protein